MFKEQIRRINFIDEQLTVRRGALASLPNCHSMAAKYSAEFQDVSARTIQRDIAFMQELGAPIEYDSNRTGYHYTEPWYRFPALTLSQSELESVDAALSLLGQGALGDTSIRIAAILKRVRDSVPRQSTASRRDPFSAATQPLLAATG